MKKTDNAAKILFKRIKSNYEFRTMLFSFVSFFITILFTCYNVFLGFAYRSGWNICIAVYYALLSFVRARVIFSEMKYRKLKSDEAEIENKRKKLFFEQSIVLFAIDLALIAPIAMMLRQKRPINYSEIPAISVAAYTTYKIIVSAVNFAKTRNIGNLSVKLLKNINFIDALVSVLSLQYTLIMTFGGAVDSDMFVLCTVSSLLIWLFLVGLSFLSVLGSIELLKR